MYATVGTRHVTLKPIARWRLHMCACASTSSFESPGGAPGQGELIKDSQIKTSGTNILRCSQPSASPLTQLKHCKQLERVCQPRNPQRERSEVQLCGHHGEGRVQGRMREVNQACTVQGEPKWPSPTASFQGLGGYMKAPLTVTSNSSAEHNPVYQG